MDNKSTSGNALNEFCREFGVPEHLTFDVSKEQVKRGATFIKNIKKYNIDYHISETNLHNHQYNKSQT